MAPSLALARGNGGAPLVGFGEEVLTFMTRTLGPTLFGIGLAVAAISLLLGSRDALMKAVWCVVGGGLLFGIDSIKAFVQYAAGR
jgi:hypothetical protein